MGNILAPPERAQPIAPNGRILKCQRCESPAAAGVRCMWCQDYPELDKKGKFVTEATAHFPLGVSVVDVAAHVCQSDSCTTDDEQVVAVSECSWCRKIETAPSF